MAAASREPRPVRAEPTPRSGIADAVKASRGPHLRETTSGTTGFTGPAEPIESLPVPPAPDGVATRRRFGFGRPLVEAVRLIMVALFASAGWEVASSTGPDTTPRLILGIALGDRKSTRLNSSHGY